MKKKKNDSQETLEKLLAEALPEQLIELISSLANSNGDVRYQVFDYLNKNISLSEQQQEVSEGEAIMALWEEIEPNLRELDDYGGGNYEDEENVGDLLYDLFQELEEKEIGKDYRDQIREQIMPYIISGNAGMDDALYDVAYATCQDNDDLRNLALTFESMNQDWPKDHARRIYLKIGDHEKYLELRKQKMEYGGDYYELANFYWNNGQKQKAISIAEKGLKKGKGRMGELREFLMSRAQESKDRPLLLNLQFEQTTDRLTLEKYKTFRGICSKDEWLSFDKKMEIQITQASIDEKLKIYMHLKEYKKAVSVITKSRYPFRTWGGDTSIKVASQLEKRFPEEILKFYSSGLGNLNRNDTRQEYARKASVMAKVRRVYVDIMKKNEQWISFAQKIKKDNLRRPAFQDEFGKVIKDWKTL
jgi:hypothetical protein